LKENREVSENLVSVEKTLSKEFLIRVKEIEEGLAQTDERVKQLEENFRSHSDKGDK